MDQRNEIPLEELQQRDPIKLRTISDDRGCLRVAVDVTASRVELFIVHGYEASRAVLLPHQADAIGRTLIEMADRIAHR